MDLAKKRIPRFELQEIATRAWHPGHRDGPDGQAAIGGTGSGTRGWNALGTSAHCWAPPLSRETTSFLEEGSYPTALLSCYNVARTDWPFYSARTLTKVEGGS